MEKYIALLRGVNVGGKNKVPMKLLKDAFEEAGYAAVSTYINSGNLLFSCKAEPIAILQQACRKLIMDTFQLDISVAVISIEELSRVLDHTPSWWGNDPESRHNAIFVIPPSDAKSVVKEVGELKPEYEQVACFEQVIFWSAPIETFSQTRWSKIIANSSYKSITIRNANTIKKILERSKACE